MKHLAKEFSFIDLVLVSSGLSKMLNTHALSAPTDAKE